MSGPKGESRTDSEDFSPLRDRPGTRFRSITSISERFRPSYSPVSNIGDIRSLEERSDEGSIVLYTNEVGLDTFLEQFV